MANCKTRYESGCIAHGRFPSVDANRGNGKGKAIGQSSQALQACTEETGETDRSEGEATQTWVEPKLKHGAKKARKKVTAMNPPSTPRLKPSSSMWSWSTFRV
jgi:hypothetical protein